jgi:5'-3' exonuclease
MGAIALIDGDIVAYRVAWTCEANSLPKAQDEGIAFARVDELLDRILATNQTPEYHVFISGSENFRRILCPVYKRNRDDKPKPRLLDPIRNFLVREWGAEVTSGYEADDGIGILGAELQGGSREGKYPVYCSIDKDFRQLVGRHYNFVKDAFEDISPQQAALAFWSLMLIGDASDNVRGVDGIGPIKARRNLADLSPIEMEHRVRELYADDERFALNRVLLRILQSEREYLDIEDKIRQGQRPTLATGST